MIPGFIPMGILSDPVEDYSPFMILSIMLRPPTMITATEPYVGCIAGNGLGSKGTYRGLASDCLLIGLKCLNQGGTGDIRSVLSALQWVHDNRDRYSIRVVHIPFGVYHPFPLGQDPLIMAVERLWDEGLVVVCAAGNNGPHRASIASPAHPLR